MSSKAAMPPAAEALRLAAFLPYQLSVASNRVSRAIARRYEAEFGLTIPEWRVMAVLGQSPGLTAAALAEATAMDKVAISRAVARLKAQGRLSAVKDAADARRQKLALTAAGKRVYQRVAARALALEAALIAKIGAKDAEALAAILLRVAAAAEGL
jgi:DNA-binding MarR family transcriptional regulator